MVNNVDLLWKSCQQLTKRDEYVFKGGPKTPTFSYKINRTVLFLGHIFPFQNFLMRELTTDSFTEGYKDTYQKPYKQQTL